jgi:excinuclease ABC subunit C
MERILRLLKHDGVRIDHQPRGKMALLMDMAKKNAEMKLLDRRGKDIESGKRFSESGDVSAVLMELKADLDLDVVPYRIEAFDISNLQSESPVGSLVTFQDGAARRSGYRRFKMRTKGINDFEMMAEAVHRYYSKNPVPDLILIDGGPVQLKFAIRALRELGLKDCHIIGLAKRNEEIYLPGRRSPLILDRFKPSLLLLQRIRDESHRFAISYHRKRLAKRTLHSELEDIPGVSEKRGRALLVHFGSIARLREADPSEISEVHGIGKKLAVTIYDGLHRKGGNHTEQ